MQIRKIVQQNTLARSTSLLLYYFLTVIAVCPILGCIKCGNRGQLPTGEEMSVFGKDAKEVDAKEIANCLLDFIKNNKDDPNLLILGLELKENSVEGPIVQEREDLWFIGKWTCQVYDSYLIANYARHHRWGEGAWVDVRIEKSLDGKYVVVDRQIKHVISRRQ